jgi:hypothetical protein
MYEKTNGNYGRGFLIIATNNINKYVEIDYTVYWNTTDNKNINTYNASFALDMAGVTIKSGMAWHSHFHPILKLTIIVKLLGTSTSASRSGIQIGSFVFFTH